MKDDLIDQFDKTELLSVLQKNEYHSTEVSESEDESRSKLASGKNFVHVYDHLWRSDTVNIINIYYIFWSIYLTYLYIFKNS